MSVFHALILEQSLVKVNNTLREKRHQHFISFAIVSGICLFFISKAKNVIENTCIKAYMEIVLFVKVIEIDKHRV